MSTFTKRRFGSVAAHAQQQRKKKNGEKISHLTQHTGDRDKKNKQKLNTTNSPKRNNKTSGGPERKHGAKVPTTTTTSFDLQFSRARKSNGTRN